jgi:type I restriction enzyme S subunit
MPDKLIDVTGSEFERFSVQEGDLLFGRRSLVLEGSGKCAKVEAGGVGCVFESSLIRARLDPDRADPDYYLAFFLSPEGRYRVLSIASQTAVSGIRGSDLGRLSVPAPPLEAQRKIGSAIRAFDELIEVNRRRIEILTELARLIYREWFVEFRFPGHGETTFVESKLGDVPNGWQRVNLFDIAEVGFGYSFKSNRFADEGPFPVVRIRDIPLNTTRTYTDEAAGGRYEIHDGDSLVGMDGDFHMCRWADGLAYLNQRVARIRSSGVLTQYHLHLALEQPIRRFNESISGTTVAHLGKRHLEEIALLVPADPVLRWAQETFQPMFDLEINLRKQNRVLEAARDLLLPRLISGDLDIADLEVDLEPVA